MGVKIRPATLEDLGYIQKLCHKLCEKEYQEFDKTVNPDFPIRKKGKEYLRERISGKDGCAFVAIVDNRVVGYLVGAIAEASRYRSIPRFAEAENMFVLEEFRSLGVGKRLFERFVEWTKSKKVTRIRVVASAGNEKGIEFYRKEGLVDYDVTLEKEI